MSINNDPRTGQKVAFGGGHNQQPLQQEEEQPPLVGPSQKPKEVNKNDTIESAKRGPFQSPPLKTAFGSRHITKKN